MPQSNARVNYQPKADLPGEVADWVWAANYGARYDEMSRKAAMDRSRRRQKAREHSPERVAKQKAAAAAARARLEKRFAAEVLPRAPNARFWDFVELHAISCDKDAVLVWRAECEPIFREQRLAQFLETSKAVHLRWSEGFKWDGGSVGDYEVPALDYEGLLSDEHPILQFFVSKLPRAKHLVSGGHKGEAVPAQSKLLACDDPYIEGSKLMRGFLRVEIDRIFSWAEIETACRETGIPVPNVVVGWVGPDGRVHRPHLIWLLAASVCFTEAGKKRFQALFGGVLRGLTSALLPFGADAGGRLNCMRVKNPLSPLWSRRVFGEAPYSLAMLKATVDTEAGLPTDEPTGPVAQDHPDAEVAVGSNAFFRKLAAWARRAIRPLRDGAGVEFEEWALLAAEESLRLVGRLSGDIRRAEQSAVRLAGKVARWTWDNVRPQRAPERRLSDEEVQGRLAEGGRLAATVRADKARAAIIAAARQLAAEGREVTQVAIAKLAGVSERTVRRHRDVLIEAEPSRTDAPPC